MAIREKDPTYGMTMTQKDRHEKRMRAKPRPRDIFNVQAILKKRNKLLSQATTETRETLELMDV